MSCFIVPLMEAIAVTAVRKSVRSAGKAEASLVMRNLPALEKMLWGGTLMLVVDHIINGELTWRFPFLTALETGGWEAMLRELLTVGVPMAAVLTVAWVVWALLKERRTKNAAFVKNA